MQIVGRDALSEQDKWDLEMGEIVRVAFLQQNAYDPHDAFNTLEQQMRLSEILKDLQCLVSEEIERGVLHQQVQGLGLLRQVLALRGAPAEDFEKRSHQWLEEVARSLTTSEGR